MYDNDDDNDNITIPGDIRIGDKQKEKVEF